MPGMDAIALLENLGVKVKAVGRESRHNRFGSGYNKNTTITLELL
jgi:cell division protein FtsI (penicillin-binding protein 3)